MPLAATLTTERIFSAFLGGPERTLYYGHSYTANPLGCAAALANLAIFREERLLEKLRGQIAHFTRLLDGLRALGEVLGLTRPIRDVVVLMPPYCITKAQLVQAVEAVALAVAEVK